ncbi:MAG TPA: NADH-quinone oxidoreductase subunit NuoH, partial [Polyangia bacterium]
MTAGFHLLVVVVILVALLSVAAVLIWYERRLLAAFQDRFGPNRVGPFGLGQPLADVVKLLAKEDWIPPFADAPIFVLAPTIVVVSVLAAFAVIPFTHSTWVADLNVGLLFVLGMFSLGVYSVTLGGWASNNKYSLIGGMRAAAQLISYELPLGLSLVGVVMLAGSFRLTDIVAAQHPVPFIVYQPLGFLIFMVAGFAEARRTPFDLPEADSELVAGYHTEYSSMKFALFFMGEYLDITLVSCLTTVLFLGGWHGPLLPGIVWFALKAGALISLFIWVRSIIPRYRFDQLMNLGWKVLTPLALANILVTGAVALLVGQGGGGGGG